MEIDFNPHPRNADSPMASVVERLSKTTTDGHPTTREHNFIDEKLQRRPAGSEVETNE
jgi:hypothetical protein